MRKGAIEIGLAFVIIGVSLSVFSSDIPSFLLPVQNTANEAAVFNVNTINPWDLQEKYQEISSSTPEEIEKVRIFIMPGHEPNYGGAEYNGIIERNLNLITAKHLKEYLEADSHYEVVMGRDENGWNPDLKKYFDENWTAINKWKDEQQKIMSRLVAKGEVTLVEQQAVRQTVTSDVGTRLYGINKWVGENDFDIAIHLHVNDYGSRGGRPGEFSGYVIFAPEDQYSNSGAAKMVARSVSARLDQFVAQSDAKKEKGGVVEDQELVALGRYNTADVPSILIEYGYIYEPQFNKSVRDATLKEYAYQTYLGINEFFETDDEQGFNFQTATLPYEWKNDISGSYKQSADVFALQLALHKYDLYPPKGKNLNQCPISGVFGACTKLAVNNFQNKYSITGEEGRVGPITREILNTLFK
jgi:N-acetylmuramoyl-L-alanine amidase